MTNPERRSAPRQPVSVKLRQHVESDSHACRAISLSLSGLYMKRPLGAFVRHTAEVALELWLPDGREAPLWVSGEVVYDCFDPRHHGSAVRFTGMSADDRSRLGAFLEGGIDGPHGTRAHTA